MYDREIEKLKLSELTCRQGVIEVAKMWVTFKLLGVAKNNWSCSLLEQLLD